MSRELKPITAEQLRAYYRNRNTSPEALASVPWPVCGDKCWSIAHFGADECDATCPKKFPEQPEQQH